MSKINFKCPTCGGTKLLHVEFGALLKSPIDEIWAEDGEVDIEYQTDGTTVSMDEGPTSTVRYECEKCGGYLVRKDGSVCDTAEDMYKWLHNENMLGG